MPSAYTTTDALSDSLPDMIAGSRIVRENVGVMASPSVVDIRKLDNNEGIDWTEVQFEQLTAQSVTETTELDNPQQLQDTPLTITPSMAGIHIVILDRVGRRLSKNTTKLAQGGILAQNAVERQKDLDGITVLDGATTSLGGAGTTMAHGYVSAGATRITSNGTEPGVPPINCVLHGYGIKDIEDEIIAGIGTYPVPEGMSAETFKVGYRGMVGGAQLYEDGNIQIDSSSDAKGGVFAKNGVVLVQGMAPKAETKRLPELGGGATAIYFYDEYAYGERSSGNWLYELYHDATAATS